MKYLVFAAALAASPALADRAFSIDFAGDIAGKLFSGTQSFDGIGVKGPIPAPTQG